MHRRIYAGVSALNTPFTLLNAFWSLLIAGTLAALLVSGTALAKPTQKGAGAAKGATLVWPVSGYTLPDFPHSSPFGPRLKASEAFRYDFHRGIDLPVPQGTPVVAIADGVVRLAGDYAAYTDTVIQIRHYREGKGPETCANRGCYYANYLHMSAVAVSEGQEVKQGQVVGYTGASVSGFEHLHFEIRDGGIYQQHAINPWSLLPYPDTDNLGVSLDLLDFSIPDAPVIRVQVQSASSELDFNRVELAIYDETGDGDLLAESYVDYQEWNRLYTPQDAPHRYLDQADFNGITLQPARFSSASEFYEAGFEFHQLTLSYLPAAVRVVARVYDVNDSVAVEVSAVVDL